MSQKLLDKLITIYKTESAKKIPGSNVELEIRFRHVSADMFLSLYKSLLADKNFGERTLECSINVISRNALNRSNVSSLDDSSYVRKMIYTRGLRTSTEYYQKQRLIKSVQMPEYIKYNIAVSRETKIAEFPTAINATCRFKVRASFASTANTNWRFDLTIIKQGDIASLGKTGLEKIKDAMFKPALSIDNLGDIVEGAADNAADTYSFEVELEYIGEPAAVAVESFQIVKNVFAHVNNDYLIEIARQEELDIAAHVLGLAKGLSFKRICNQVIAITKAMYFKDCYPCDGMYITDKADGVRAFMRIFAVETIIKCRIVTSASMYEYTAKSEDYKLDNEYILDCELVESEGDKKPAVYIFDVIEYAGKNLAAETFVARYGAVDESAKIVNNLFDAIICGTKKYIVFSQGTLESQIRELWEDRKNRPYTVDGLIITTPAHNYLQTLNYKWKPTDHQTIDFLAVKCPAKLLGIKPYVVVPKKTLYLLFVGINHRMRESLGLQLIPQYKSIFAETSADYYPIQFMPSANPLAYLWWNEDTKVDDLLGDSPKVVELVLDIKSSQWQFMRMREDRKLERGYFGNDYKVAELIYMNYIDLFDLEDLWKPRLGYFAKSATDIYQASNKFKRFVISNLIKADLSGAGQIIDLAAGRGADIHRYQEVNVKSALFIDIDANALAELVKRKFEYLTRKRSHARGWLKESNDEQQIRHSAQFAISTLVADLKGDYRAIMEKVSEFGVKPGGADGCVCNFAIHYMCDSIDHIRNLLKLVASSLKLGGVFIFTTMNGAEVAKLLVGRSEWRVLENEAPKYVIKKKYTGDKLAIAGQMVSVLLPFSDEMYDEPLANIDVIIAEGHKLGLEVEANASFATYFDKFERIDVRLWEKLTDDDKFYISLHQYVTMRKVKEVKL